MELMYPIAIIICLIIGLAIFFINTNKTKYTTGKKVANTQYIKETEYYKEKVKKYHFLSNAVKILSVICIFITGILISRPITLQSKSEDKYNRDILMGLDISTSQCEVNLELVRRFKQIIPSIEGDRIGIVIFNTAPVVYCPLTDDYDYINECLDTIEKQLQIVVENNGYVPYTATSEDSETFIFWNGGTVVNNEERGSSLVGDGLARNIVFIS